MTDRPTKNERYRELFKKLEEASKEVAADPELVKKYKTSIAEIDARDLTELSTGNELTGEKLLARVKKLAKKKQE